MLLFSNVLYFFFLVFILVLKIIGISVSKVEGNEKHECNFYFQEGRRQKSHFVRVCVCVRALEEVVLENAASVSKSLVSWALVSSGCMVCLLILRFLPEGIAVGLCCAFLPFQEPPVFPECVRRGECGRRCCRVLYACVFFGLS